MGGDNDDDVYVGMDEFVGTGLCCIVILLLDSMSFYVYTKLLYKRLKI